MSIVEEAGSGFSITVTGRLVFIRHWGVMRCTLGRQFARHYKMAVKPLQTEPWAEVVDLTDVAQVEPGHKEQVATIYEYESLQNNVATAYVISERTAADLLHNVNQLMATQTASFADQFFRDPRVALNWVNQRLAMSR